MSKEIYMLGLNEFDDFAELVGNRYKAIKLITNEARDRATRYSFVNDSALLTWVVTGRKPKLYPEDISKKIRKSNRIEDILNYVSNEDIVKSVNMSIGYSKSEGHLVYRYRNSLSDYEKMRVRILVNIIWYGGD